jgi:guanylate kinase
MSAVCCAVCGPSGAGKSSLINKLLHDFPEDFGFSVSHTTRAPRAGEVDGVNYHFTNLEEMRAEVAAGKFIEHAMVHTNMYGTSRAAVEAVSSRGRICVLDIDLQGVQSCQRIGLGVALYIFVSPPSVEELERRLRARGTETDASLRVRLDNATKEMEGSRTVHFDHRIVNDDLDRAYRCVRCVVCAGARCPVLSSCCTVLCCAVLCCAVLCCAVLCCAVLCCAVLCCAVLCCAVLRCAVLHCAALCCTVLSS